MIEVDDIPKTYYQLEYQTDICVGTDEWEKGNAYETEVGAQSALIAHINSYPFLPVRIRRVTLKEEFELLGHFFPS